MAGLHSERQGRARSLSERDLTDLVWRSLVDLASSGYILQATGPHPRSNVGVGFSYTVTPPTVTADLEGYLTRRLKTSGIGADLATWNGFPPTAIVVASNLDLLLDLLEVVHEDLISKPVLTGGGLERFDKAAGQAELRGRVNPDLALLDTPYELLASGQVVEKQPEEFDTLLKADVPESLPPQLSDPVDAAIGRYRDRHSTQADRLAAVQQLANVLEGMRGDVKRNLLSKDEGALFDIANNFGIRHLNARQKLEYDKDIWLAWMFYVYLATIHAISRLRERQQQATS